MAINPLSGNFQPPSLTSVGNSLPSQSSGKTEQVNESKQNVAALKPAQAGSPELQKKPDNLSVEQLNEKLAPIAQNIQRGLRFQVDDVTGDTVISVIDRQTDETIRQIPPEELLTLSKRLKEVSEELDSVRGILIQTDA